ncbi:S1 family peptidase [Undibacter mobilis]|uniref:Serine protease n=1 Tax=Undibacter mobilis TaxID=2292256 RepID=A0A371BDU4_9BRAD|nr:serine protease [Undibacter mobilis]RDV05531.1 serine protease [Undibacter mobilis]
MANQRNRILLRKSYKRRPGPNQKKGYEVYLVTARHVIEAHRKSGKTEVQVRINPKDPKTPIQQFKIPDRPNPGEATWFFHPDNDIDIAIVRVNFEALYPLGYEPSFFLGDTNALTKARLIDRQVSAGDGTFVLGFPMNLAGSQKNHVIVRQGVIARISEMLEGASKTFMIDALVFPGNSGGPVVLRPEIVAIDGTKSQPSANLIGVVTSYKPYTDVAVSPQTGRPRIAFEENSGLAEVLPIDYVDETIDAWRKSQGLAKGQLAPAAPIEKR